MDWLDRRCTSCQDVMRSPMRRRNWRTAGACCSAMRWNPCSTSASGASLEARRLVGRANDARRADRPRSTMLAANACARSRCAPSRSCKRRCTGLFPTSRWRWLAEPDCRGRNALVTLSRRVAPTDRSGMALPSRFTFICSGKGVLPGLFGAKASSPFGRLALSGRSRDYWQKSSPGGTGRPSERICSAR
jgi:hypothetical protein